MSPGRRQAIPMIAIGMTFSFTTPLGVEAPLKKGIVELLHVSITITSVGEQMYSGKVL